MQRFVILSFLVCLCSWVQSESTKGCGGVISSELGELHSPGFPGKYNNSQRCTWIITSPNQNEKIRISFIRFNIEGSVPSCQYDHLVLRDGTSPSSPLLGKFCGDELPTKNIWSSTNKIWIQFVSDDKNTFTGFKLKYVSLPSESFPIENTPAPTILPDITCGKYIEDENGTISSPGYPDNYYSEQFCRWIIVAPHDHKIALTISFIDIEYQVLCDYDYLTILDSDSSSARVLLKACGRHTNLTFSGKQFVIEFRSDRLRSRKGFQIRWKMFKEQHNNATEKIVQKIVGRTVDERKNFFLHPKNISSNISTS